MELKNKSVNFLGDSITAGAGVKDIPANRYDNVLKKIACSFGCVFYGDINSFVVSQALPRKFGEERNTKVNGGIFPYVERVIAKNSYTRIYILVFAEFVKVVEKNLIL